MRVEQFRRLVNSGLSLSVKKPSKARLTKGRRFSLDLFGGPYDGKSIKVHSAGTLPFRINGLYGLYNTSGVWVQL